MNLKQLFKNLKPVVEEVKKEVPPPIPIVNVEPAYKMPGYYSPRISSEINDCSLPLTFDSYSKCSMNCEFCFASLQKCNTPGAVTAPLQGVNVQKLLNMIDGKTSPGGEAQAFYDFFFSKKFIFHWGGLADPFCKFEKKFSKGYTIMKELADRKYPTLFSFKGNTILDDKYLQLFDDYKHNNSFAFQLSIVTADDKLSKTLERGVPPPSERFKIMKILSDMGYWTVLRLRPYIIGVTDLSIDEILVKGLNAGMNAISTEFYALEGRTNEQSVKQYEVMAKLTHVDNIINHFKVLSPVERGTYRRLNRHIKEPYVKKLYKFCAENNLVFACSDPDYKELSMTSCCCSLPENHPKNPDFNNYLKLQLTDAMKRARRLYHTTGERMLLTFDDTYGKEESFLDDKDLSHQNYGCTAHNYAYRKQLTTRHIIQAQWNTLQSSASPSRYFHGKVMPIGLDELGENLVYQYMPSEYETRWTEEGINLTL
jgi:DNA repair photolyase